MHFFAVFRSMFRAIMVMMVMIGGFAFAQHASAAIITWDGGAADENWNSCANWSGNVCPTSVDVATFDATSTKNATINSAINVQGIDINTGYSGTITQGSGQSVTVGSGNYDQATGTFTGTDAAITMNGSFTISGGTFTAPSSATLTIASSWTRSGGTFTHNSGTVQFTGVNVTYDFPTTETFNNVTLNAAFNATKTIATGDTLIVSGTFSCSEGRFQTGTLELRGDATWNTGCDGNFGLTRIAGTGDQTLTLTPTDNILSNVTVDKASGNVYLGANWVSNVGTFTVQSGTMNLRNAAASQNYNFTISAFTLGGGVFNAGSSTISMSSTYSQTNGTFNGGSATITHTGTFSLSGGTYNQSTGTTAYADAFTQSGTGVFNHNNGTTNITGANSQFNFVSSLTFFDVTMNAGSGSSKTIAAGDTFIVANTFTVNEAGFLTGNLELRGNATWNAGADTAPTVTVTGTGDQTLTAVPSNLLNTLTINKASGNVFLGANLTTNTGTLTLQAGTMYARNSAATNNYAISISAFSQSGGTFHGGSSTISYSSNFTVSGGTHNQSSGTTSYSAAFTISGSGVFSHGNGTANFTGGSATIDVLTNVTFFDVTMNPSSTAVKTIASGDTLIVANGLTVNEGGFSTGTLELRGNATWNSGADSGSSPITVTGTGDQTLTLVPTSNILGNVTVNKASGNVFLGANWSNTASSFTLQAGTMFLRNASATNNYSFTGNTFTQNGGTFHGGSSTVQYNATFTLGGGTHNASSGTTTYQGPFTQTAGSFVHNDGTSVFTGGNALLDVATSISFGALTLNKTNLTTLSFGAGDTVIATGTLTLTEGKWDGSTLEARGNVSVGANFDNNTTANFRFGGSAVQTFTLTSITSLCSCDVYVDKSGGRVDLGSSFTMTANNNDLFIQEGTFDLNGNALTVTAGATERIIVESGGNLQMQGGETITADSGSFPQFDAGSTATYDGTAASYALKDYTYQSLVINGGSTSVFALSANESLGGNLTITSGILDQAERTLAVTGTFSNDGTLRRRQTETFTGTMDVDSGTVEYRGDGDGTPETVTITDFNVGGIDYFRLRINDSNATKDTFVLGANLTVANVLQVTAGTMQQGSNAIVASGITVDGGTFTGGGSSISNSGTFTLSAGTFTSTTATLTQSAGWTNTGGTFTHNSGTVTFTGSAATIDPNGTEVFNNLTIEKSDAQVVTIPDTEWMQAVGTLRLNNGAVNGGSTGGLNPQGNVVVASGYDGGTAMLSFTGANTQAFDLTGGEDRYNAPININKSSNGVTLLSGIVLDATTADLAVTLGTFSTGGFAVTTSTGSDITVNGGTWNSGASTMAIGGNLTVSSGTFNGNTSTPTYAGAVLVNGGAYAAGSSAPSFNGTFSLSGGSYNGGSGTNTFANGLTISGGVFTASSQNTNVAGNWTNTSGGTFTHNSGTVTFTGSAATIDVGTSTTFSSLTMNKSNGQALTIASGDALVVTGVLTLTNGAVSTGTLEPQGAVSIGAGFDGGSAAMKFSGSAEQTITSESANDTWNGDIEVAKASGTVAFASPLVMDATGQDLTVTSGTLSTANFALTIAGNVAVNGGTLSLGSSSVDWNGNLTVNGGTLQLGSSTVTLAGNATYASGTMTPGTSVVTLDGANQQLSGATTWHSLTKSVTSASTLTFPAATTTTVNGTLTLQGSTGQLLSLRSSTPGTQAVVSAAVFAQPSFLDVRDNRVSPSVRCLSSSSGCVDSGNNFGWTFRSANSVQVPSGTVGDGGSTVARTYNVEITSPNGGETIAAGSTVSIYWQVTGNTASPLVTISASYDAGATWRTLAAGVPNDDVYVWTVPSTVATSRALIKVAATDLVTTLEEDVSDAVFSIVQGSAVVSGSDEEVQDIADRVASLPDGIAVHGLIKLPDDGNSNTSVDSAVYYVGADGKRHAFPNERVYASWFCDFSGVQVVTQSQLSAIPIGENVTYRPGYRMVKFLSLPKVYAVDRFGVLHWVETEVLARSLYGSAWNTKIDDISDAFFGNYTFGDSISSADAFDPLLAQREVAYPSDSFVIPGYIGSTSEGLQCAE